MANGAMTYKDRMKELGCVVVIPTYNNAGTIEQVINDVSVYSSDIIVVNDGSTDGTSEILRNIDGIRVIGYKQNKGKGYALKTALSAAYESGYRYAITIDSDGQHFADDIPVFLERILQVPDSLLVGARNLTADNMPSKNTFANRISNFWYRVETGHILADTQSGFRLYPLDKIQGIRFITVRYEFEVEIIVRAAWRGINVENVPVKVFYPPVEERVSHFRPFQDFVRISMLNTMLVLFAFLVHYPWKFLRSLTWKNVKDFFDKQVIHSGESNFRMAAAMGWGVFCGIIPIWGYQMLLAIFGAHLMKLNKVISVVFSNISIPPMIPFILYGSMVAGAWLLNIENRFAFGNISVETFSFTSLGTGIWQYVAGSVALALIAALVTVSVSFVILSFFRRR